ncbi:MAG: TRAP transporter substrate-binding protein DctP [Acidobacteria bacterium]|jgi:TRAP-type C4-dicarboxylate transport system substrate-binding protein|nr:TRAP transporter substrate-binding protein DctP [Acidobacteriota bacterium]
MSKPLTRVLGAAALALTALMVSLPMQARAPLTVKLATFAPANSAWHKALLDMGDAWTKTTEGRVTLRVYPGGTLGTEASTVKMMSPAVGELQAALLLPPGLAKINDAVDVFGMPFFLESDEEMRAVFAALRPLMTQRIEAAGFKVLHWGNAGWVQLFSKKEIRTLADLKVVKLYTTEGDDKSVQWYKNNGFQPIPLSFNDMVGGLKRGMIDAAPSPAYGASMLQIFRDAPFLLDVKLAPLLGATVLTNAAWAKIDAADQPRVMAAASALEQRFMGEAPKMDADAVATMSARGLKVTKLTPAAMVEFRKTAEALVSSMRGTTVPTDVYDAAMQARTAFRKTKGK